MPSTKSRDSDSSQIERFKEAARELGADESEERFREAVRQVGRAPPAPKGAQMKKPKPAK